MILILIQELKTPLIAFIYPKYDWLSNCITQRDRHLIITNALGKYESDALRDLAKLLKIAGLSPAQCAIGFRTMKTLSEQGIDSIDLF